MREEKTPTLMETLRITQASGFRLRMNYRNISTTLRKRMITFVKLPMPTFQSHISHYILVISDAISGRPASQPGTYFWQTSMTDDNDDLGSAAVLGARVRGCAPPDFLRAKCPLHLDGDVVNGTQMSSLADDGSG